jgi:hypothetical protein
VLDAAGATGLKAVYGAALPDWYLRELCITPLVGATLRYIAIPRVPGNSPEHARTLLSRQVVWDIEWMDANAALWESQSTPGIVAMQFGYLPVGTCCTGSGNPFFVRFAESDDPPLVQMFHDGVSEVHGMNEKSMWIVAPSLSEFFSEAQVLAR